MDVQDDVMRMSPSFFPKRGISDWSPKGGHLTEILGSITVAGTYQNEKSLPAHSLGQVDTMQVKMLHQLA